MLTIHVCWLGAYLNQRSVGRRRVFLLFTTGCSGGGTWRSSYCEHDPGWRSAAADADDLCHWGGFQDSALTAALTSQGKHTPTQTHIRTCTRQINTSGPLTAWVRRPSMTHFDYSVLKQQVTGLPRMSSVRLASVQRRQFRIHGEQQAGKMPDLQVSCPITDIKWAQDVMSSSRKSSIPLSGWIKLSVAAEGQISVAGHTLPPRGNVWKINPWDAGLLNKGRHTDTNQSNQS